jgi:hypothetical protein
LRDIVRDPRYIAPLAVLVAVILVSAALGGRALPSVGASDQPTPTARPTEALSPEDQLLDARRALDLGYLRDALALYRRRNGAYPSTGGRVATLCDKPSDAGCALSSLGSRLPFSDGELPYWYASDGATYFSLISRAQQSGDTSQCPRPLPKELAVAPVMCVRGEAGG